MEIEEFNKNSKLHLFLIALFMVLCYIGNFAQYTIMSQYIYYKISSVHKDLPLTVSQCYANQSFDNSSQSKIQAEVARYNIYAQLSSGIPSMITVVIFGILSDIHGRKFIIMISWFGLFVGTIFNIFLIVFKGPLWIYIFGQFISGLGGNYGAMLTGVLSLISDSTTKKTRNFGIVLIELTLGISMIISQALLGLWLLSKDFLGPIITFGSIFLISGIVLFFIKETRPKNPNPNGLSYRFYLYVSIGKMFKIFIINSKLHYHLIITLSCFFLHTFNFFGNLSLITLYLFGKPFCWNSKLLGYYRSISSAIIQIGMILSVILIKFGFNEILIVELGFLTNIGSKILFSIAPSFYKPVADFVIYGASLDIFSGASVSLLRSISSKLVSPDEFGSLFGVMSSLETLSSLTGGVIFNAIYECSFVLYYGIIYMCSGILLFLAFLLMILYYYKKPDYKGVTYYILED